MNTKLFKLSNQTELNIETIAADTYANVINNWDEICAYDPSILVVLDMNTNSLCHYFKQSDPLIGDTHIQARVLTVMMIMYCIMDILFKQLSTKEWICIK